jgi:flavin-dependent dehydrogenase
MNMTSSSHQTDHTDHGAIVVGASLAGCATSMLLARHGVRVALVEKSPNPQGFKRMCSHYIQTSAIATLERLDMLEKIEQAGGVRSRVRIWSLAASQMSRDTHPRGGFVDLGAERRLPPGVNIRRELLDPLLRGVAAETNGVDLMLGKKVTGLVRDSDRIAGVEFADGKRLRAPLVVGADGCDTVVARLARQTTRRVRNARFNYAAYYDGPSHAQAPDTSLWLLDPEWASAMPTDSGLTVYACMPTHDRLPEFKRDPEKALTAFIAGLPDAPPILESKRVGPIIGKVKMANVIRSPISAGLALVGDAAVTADPLWGVGCGWAFQSAEWLADSVARGCVARNLSNVACGVTGAGSSGSSRPTRW